jgi:hydroxymethylpyrimidine pyrophosphatase-like HAD family hydrolase
MSALDSTWEPKLVALDVDGTIVGYDQFFDSPTSGAGVTPAVKSAIHRTRDRGVHITLATGRAWHSTMRVLKALDLTTGYAVCSNGAAIVDVATEERVHVASFDAAAPVSYFAEQVPDAALAVESPDGEFRVTGDFPAEELDSNFRVVTHDELLDGSVTRLVVRWPNGDRRHLRNVARASGLPSVDYAIGYSAWLDIMPKGVSKASGLTFVCDQLGISANDVLAVGDGHNDTDMLTWAGRGVAMGQSPDDVKAVADEVCDDVTDDGVATLLERYFA